MNRLKRHRADDAHEVLVTVSNDPKNRSWSVWKSFVLSLSKHERCGFIHYLLGLNGSRKPGK